MKKIAVISGLLFTLFFACKKDVEVVFSDEYAYDPTPYIINLPSTGGWSEVPVPSDNPMTKAGVSLGKQLFFDPILSANNKQSCASCHNQKFAFSDDGKQFSEGAFGDIGERNSMPLFNLPWADKYAEGNHRYFWDGGANDMERQVLGPITNPLEMANTLPNAVSALQKHPQYPKLFKRAFGSDSITTNLLAKAIAQYERTLISSNSKYDKYLRGEVQLTPEEHNGKFIFFAENKGDCFHCHGNTNSPYFTDFSFKNNGLNRTFADSGLARITGKASDLGKFKVPSLRNLVFTFPYMHNGSLRTLEDVVEFYSSGIKNSPTLDPNLAKHVQDGGVNLNPIEKRDLILFLKTLTDSSFINNTEFMK